jgi:hypothetical protein
MDTASGQGMGVHIFGPPTDLRVAFKADFSSLRLNLLVQDGLVVDAAVG